MANRMQNSKQQKLYNSIQIWKIVELRQKGNGNDNDNEFFIQPYEIHNSFLTIKFSRIHS